MSAEATGKEIGTWIWSNREKILEQLQNVRQWWSGRNGKKDKKVPGVLVLGPQGVGKSTFGGFLAGNFDHFLKIPGIYNESIGVETFNFCNSDEPVVVGPGQTHRRDAWGPLLNKMREGGFRGVVLISANGYNSIGEIDYTSDPDWDGDKINFIKKYTSRIRENEREVWNYIASEIKQCRHKIWLLQIVNKKDLWWHQNKSVEAFYCERHKEVTKQLTDSLGLNNFRSELLFTSLFISKFTTSNRDILAENAAGYDQEQQVTSLRKLIETLDALRGWERN